MKKNYRNVIKLVIVLLLTTLFSGCFWDNWFGSEKKKDETPPKLTSITVNGAVLQPSFNSEVFEYEIAIPTEQEKITINATTTKSEFVISGLGEKSISIGKNEIIINVKGNGKETNYKLNVTRAGVVAPKVSVPDGTYTTNQSIVLYTETKEVDIYYTVDMSEPTTESGIKYGTPIFINKSTVIKAISVGKTTNKKSAVMTAVYKITGTVEKPKITVLNGSDSSYKYVELTCDTLYSKIYYTTDGTNPNEMSKPYIEKIKVQSTQIIKSIAFREGFKESDVITKNIEVVGTISNPTFNLNAGTYSTSQSIKIDCSISGAEIRYTTDGSIPTTNSALYVSDIKIDKTTVIKAKVFNNDTESGVTEALYTIIEIAENVKIISNEDSFKINVAENSSTIKINEEVVGTKEFKVGDIIANTDKELLVKIKSIQKSGNDYVFETERATLAEAIPDGEIIFQGELKYDNLSPVMQSKYRSLGIKRSITPGFEFTFTKKIPLDKKSEDETQSYIEVSFPFSLSFDIYNSTKKKEVVNNHFYIIPKISPKISYNVVGTIPITDWKVDVITIPLGTIALPTPVPLVLSGDLNFTFILNGNISGGLKGSAGITAQCKLGTKYNTVTKTNEFIAEPEVTGDLDIGLSLGAQFTFAFVPKVDLKINGGLVAGGVGIPMGPRVKLDLFSRPFVTVDFVIDPFGNIYSEVFGIKLGEQKFDIGKELAIKFYEWDGPDLKTTYKLINDKDIELSWDTIAGFGDRYDIKEFIKENGELKEKEGLEESKNINGNNFIIKNITPNITHYYMVVGKYVTSTSYEKMSELIEITIPKLNTPIITPESGTYNEVKYLFVEPSNEGAEIRYTTDGSEPTKTSKLYLPYEMSPEETKIDHSQTIKVKLFKDGYLPSETVTKNYTVNIQPLITLKSIELTKFPKTIYTMGETFSIAGAEVTGIYSDGSKKTLVGWTTTTPIMTTAGTKTVKVSYADGGTNYVTTFEITVKSLAASLTLNSTAKTLKEKETFQMTAVVLPADADQTLKWTSSNPAAATVELNTGKVTAVAKGTAVITAMTVVGNISASCTITVTLLDGLALYTPGADSQAEPIPIDFSWEVKDATGYRIQIIESNSLPTVGDNGFTGTTAFNKNTGTNNYYTWSMVQDSGADTWTAPKEGATYWWTVRYTNSTKGVTSGWSTPQKFITAKKGLNVLDSTYDEANSKVVAKGTINPGGVNANVYIIAEIKKETDTTWVSTKTAIGVFSGATTQTINKNLTGLVKKDYTYQVRYKFTASFGGAAEVETVYSNIITVLALGNEKVLTPVFNPIGGTYSTAQTVTITCVTDGATIRYTTDGSEPTESSPIYSNAMQVTTSQTIKAKAFKIGMTASDTAEAIYVINISQVTTSILSQGDNLSFRVEQGGNTYKNGTYYLVWSNGGYSDNSLYSTYDSKIKLSTSVDGVTWKTEDIADTTYGSSSHNIAIDSNNNIHIVYNEEVSTGYYGGEGQQLVYLTNSTGVWTKTILKNSEGAYRSWYVAKLFFMPNGDLTLLYNVFGWWRYQATLLERSFNGTTWTDEKIVSNIDENAYNGPDDFNNCLIDYKVENGKKIYYVSEGYDYSGEAILRNKGYKLTESGTSYEIETLNIDSSLFKMDKDSINFVKINTERTKLYYNSEMIYEIKNSDEKFDSWENSLIYNYNRNIIIAASYITSEEKYISRIFRKTNGLWILEKEYENTGITILGDNAYIINQSKVNPKTLKVMPID